MKKALCIGLSLILLFISCPLTSFGVRDTSYPTIVVPGYSASYLYAVEDDESLRQIWGSIEGLNIVDVIMNNIPKLAGGLLLSTVGYPEALAKTVGKGLIDILGDIAYKPDGTPVLETVTYENNPATTNYKYLIDEMGSMHAAELEIMEDVAEVYGENGYENIFSFQTDFRLNIVDAIEGLKKYIEDVIEYTGAEKVNIFAVSYGGQLSASYLNVYGHLGKVHNAVLTVPAIGGAALAYDVLSENVVFDEETLFYFLENGMMLEEDINWLMKAHSLGFLDSLINLIVKYGLRDILGFWGSIWDFIPAEYYEELKDKYLDPVESAELIRKSDIFHYEILPSMSEKLIACNENGTNVYIVAGADNPAVTGLYEQSDGIIHLNGATGATSAPMGMRYSDGYQGAKTVCSDISHNHMSPSMSIDASTCYIPEQTWIISGLFHGMTWKDDYVKNLCLNLLFADDSLTVHSDKQFPQFMYSTNICHSVYAEFNNSVPGFVSNNDNSFTVKNLSEKYTMKILSVKCYGADIDFDIPLFKELNPGESIDFACTVNLPESSFVTVDVSINYILVGSITPQGERNLTFTVLNGDAPAFDFGEMYSNAKHETDFENITLDCIEYVFTKLGIFSYLKMVSNCFLAMFSR